MAYVKNQILEVEITDMSENGEGIGKVDGYTLFVKDAIIGDVIRAGLTKVKKNYAFARVDEILKPSELRVTPVCEFAKQCGGCQIMAMSYEAQLKYKENKVKNDLVRIGGFDSNYIESITEPIISMENPLRYRNKAQYPIGKSKDGRVIAGFYAGRTHSIIANTNCYLGVSENKEILEKVISYMEEENIEPYDELIGKGIVRHVLIRKGFTTGEIMVCIVINADSLKSSDVLIESLTSVKGITSVSININKKNTNVILGDKCKTLWGSDTITDYIGDVKFKISPLSFFQVNPVQTKKLYEKALEYAGMPFGEAVGITDSEGEGCESESKNALSGKNVWDLYCGIGTISLFLAKKAGHVTGVEIIPQAIEDAKENAKINGIDNTDFYVGAAEDLAEKILNGDVSLEKSDADKESNVENNRNVPDIIVVDPPRKGCDEKLLSTILSVRPERVVYVSCDPATLSRDLKILCENGRYNLVKVCPVDQFPNSVHVETVTLLSNSNRKTDAIIKRSSCL